MSDESEHSESEFYYPDKLSDKELLQSPTHSAESKERKSTLLTNEEVYNFLRTSQKPATSKQLQAVKKTTFPDELSDS